jgi:hypothetical protein
MTRVGVGSDARPAHARCSVSSLLRPDTLFSKLQVIATSTPYLTGWVPPSVPRARVVGSECD